MELFKELENNEINFDNVLGFYINQPNQMSYIMYMGKHKNDGLKDYSQEQLSHYFDIMISLVSDYTKGTYKAIPIKTIIYFISALSNFVFPKQTFLNKVPGIKVFKQFMLVKLVIHSFKEDLIRYELWKKQQEKFVPV